MDTRFPEQNINSIRELCWYNKFARIYIYLIICLVNVFALDVLSCYIFQIEKIITLLGIFNNFNT